MLSRREILSHPNYWLTDMRMTVFRALNEYMKKHAMSRTELANHLKCSKGYVSQILNGDTNASLEKLAQIALAIGKAPRLQLEDLDILLERHEILSSGFTKANTVLGTSTLSPSPTNSNRLNKEFSSALQ